MLDCEDSRRQPRLIVAGMDRHDRLGDDRAAIEFRANKMNRAAGKADAGCERLPLSVQAAKGGQQRGMNIDHPVAPGLDKIRCPAPA